MPRETLPRHRTAAAPGDVTELGLELRAINGSISSLFEIVPALLLGVESADVTVGLPESIDCPCADTPEMSLELCLRIALAFTLLWLGKLSRITTSPCCGVGASWVLK
jgi:hypothetical protein